VSSYLEIRLSGSGGQGLITAGIILADAAGVEGGRYAVQTQSYGPEARGGASRSDVIVSDTPIDYPKTTSLDLLLALTQDSLDLYLKNLKPDGLCVVDSSLVTRLPDDARIRSFPITSATVDRLGKELFANIVAISLVRALSGVVPADALARAVSRRVPKQHLEVNLKALDLGQELAEQAGRST
jgi:2-oxoglutarate ferredoxin oxidoreductase subunit gamma